MDDTELYSKLLGIAPPWRVARVSVNVAAERVDVWVEEAPGTKLPCAVCREPAAVYDHTPEQMWRHLDTCQCATYVHARLARTACPVDGVKQVPAPWAEARSEYTRLFEGRIIDTCKECDVTGVRRLLRTTWDATWGVLARAVARGRARKRRRVPTHLGVDEKAIRKGHRYESLVVDLDGGTVEAVVDDRTQVSLEAYYRQFTPEELATIEAIAMDRWEPYILATQTCVPAAAKKIVFDRYHATRYMTHAVDQVRRQEHKVLQAQDDLRLKGTKPLLSKLGLANPYLGQHTTRPQGLRRFPNTHGKPTGWLSRPFLTVRSGLGRHAAIWTAYFWTWRPDPRMTKATLINQQLNPSKSKILG